MDIIAILKESLDVSKRNVAIFVPTLIVGIISFFLAIILIGSNIATVAVKGGDVTPSTVGAMFGSVVLVAVIASLLALIACAMTIGMAQEALTKGTTSLNTGWDMAKEVLGPVILVSILICVIIGIGLVIWIIPGIIAAFFLLFTLPAVVLDKFNAVDAIKKSFDIVKANLSDVVVIFIALVVIWLIIAVVQRILNIIPVLGPLVGALLGGLFGGYASVVIVRCYRIFVPAA
jgi:membrane-anchored glycerophosphoryl diester phosphodiesterase (GDPDase)